jgi:hypothetical protein
METWTDESMERPSKVPVNLIGGTLIYCDPESFPTSVPIDDKWKVTIGVHPKKVHGLRKQHYHIYTENCRKAYYIARPLQPSR